MKSHWITHKGVRIFVCDFSNLGMDLPTLEQELGAVASTLAKEPLNSVMTLTDFRGTKAAPQTVTLMKNVLSKTGPYVRRRAIVGINGTQKILLNVVNAVAGKVPITPLDDFEQAKDWLVAARS